MELLWADIRQSFRMMRKNAGFTTVAVAALALGIGANTGIFSVINKVLLEPLPYFQPDRLVKVGRQYPNGSGYSNSIPKYMVWRNNNVFSAMTLYDEGGPGLNLFAGDRPKQVKGLHISADYFKVFAVSPLRGRTFSVAEDSPNGPKAALISERLWRSHFGSDEHLIGRTIVLNGEPYPVVGLIPASFIPERPADVWIPLQADPNSTNQGHYLAVAARLKPGITLSEARAEMKLVGERFRRTNPKWMEKTESVAVTPMRDALVGDVRTALLILVGAVVLVLLIACGNVANLLLARAAVRQRELAVRAAIGASRSRIVRQLLTESIILAAMGGFFGFLLGAWGVKSLLLLVPGDIPRITEASGMSSVLALIDLRVAFFTIAVSLLTGVIFGLYPAIHISKADLASTLKEASGRSGTGRRQNRTREILVGAEMAFALVLLTSAVLLIRTFVGLNSVDPGIDPRGVLTMQTSLVGSAYNSTDKVDRFAVQVIRRVESMPGVSGAALAVCLPTRSEIDLPFNITGKAPKAGEPYLGSEQYRFISPHYFPVLKTPLIRGRFFDERDRSNSARVVIVNQAFVKKYLRKEDPLGQVIVIGKGLGPDFEDEPREVAGVVGNIRETSLSEADVPAMYVPQSQVPNGVTKLVNAALPLAWMIRTTGNPNAIRAAVEREVHAVDGEMPISKLETMEQVLSKGVARQQFNMLLLSIFAGIALLLAAIGIYGLMSYSVEQQTQELGIRVALGADRHDVLKLILKQGMLPAMTGVLAGIAIAFGATRLLATLLFGVKASDPFTFAGVALTLTAVALLASYIPARRAMEVDAAVALRNEI